MSNQLEKTPTPSTTEAVFSRKRVLEYFQTNYDFKIKFADLANVLRIVNEDEKLQLKQTLKELRYEGLLSLVDYEYFQLKTSQ